ncbi:hypothetical protein PV05_09949 [Exophiala xenobiotica]|uniref:Uncharacterized protein n=1 Tax=Exophiala xenobiotica TaxID=348802 RepID=A0A0D2CMT4_9EURO|nr:uncharacterized protein PV05_09949 [Exophiala xenobiotica]KIW51207.1 hypothetical protein PV05_09949 [Exophiala xenobiotica]
MAAVLEKLKVSKSEGMSGIGADQGALQDSNSPSFNPTKSGDQAPDPSLGVGSGEDKGLEQAPNSFGGPSFGRTSKVPRHKSEFLNSLDPRIGYDDDKTREEDLERYESKYGKPEDFPDAQLRGTDMAGVGPDQRALRENPDFASQEKDAIERGV